MKKLKIVAMLIVAMLVGLTATTISGAVELNANIKVKVNGFIGVVSPEINITTYEQGNQTVSFLVNVSEPIGEPVENFKYTVEDELKINLEIIDESNRPSFILPRFMLYRVALVREIGDAIALPKKIGSIMDRLTPAKVPFGMVI